MMGNLKKPKTNQGSRHRPVQDLDYPQGHQTDIVNSRSAHGPDEFPSQPENEHYSNTMFDRGSDQKRNDRTELTSGGSLVPSKFDELVKQKKLLDDEEGELTKQRKKVVAEKDKVTRQLKRLDKRDELMAQEEQVRKQRLILEIEKKRLFSFSNRVCTWPVFAPKGNYV